MIGDNAPPVDGWKLIPHRDSPLTAPAAEPSETHLVLGEN